MSVKVDYDQLLTNPAPHLHRGQLMSDAMKDVIIALIPVTLTSLIIFQWDAVIILVVTLLGALLGESVGRNLKGESSRLSDGSAFLTGLLLALTLPPTAWYAMVPLYFMGGFLATAVFRELLGGGLGKNRFNPALAARIFLLAGRTALVYMAPLILMVSEFFRPYLDELGAIDAMAKATPLMKLSMGEALPSNLEFIFIYEGGSLAETSVLAVLIGALYLIYKNHIKWYLPLSILTTVFIVSAIAGQDPFFHVLAGGLLFGSFFMATDWVTSPVSGKGQVIFGICIGLLVVFFRLLVERLWIGTGGVAFSIIIMNYFVPYIDRMTIRSKFGASKKRAVKGKQEATG